MRRKRIDIGLRVIKRRCYHCGYEMELAVLDGVELCPPSPEEPCLKGEHGPGFHDTFGMFINIVGKPKKEFGWETWDGTPD